LLNLGVSICNQLIAFSTSQFPLLDVLYVLQEHGCSFIALSNFGQCSKKKGENNKTNKQLYISDNEEFTLVP
jgi:hypothetical protein